MRSAVTPRTLSPPCPCPGRAGGECAALAPHCGLEDGALLQAAVELLRGGRVQLRAQSRPRRSVAGLPPLVTIAGDNNDCGTCETINSICVVFGIGGPGCRCRPP